mgnify:CR=1 FL=1
MSRRPAEPLSPQDRAHWRQLIASVRPLRPAPAAPDPASAAPERLPPAASAPPVQGAAPPPPRAAVVRPPPPPPAPPRPPLEAATLDGAWDRRLAQGRVEPELVLDLHGHGEAAAHQLVEQALHDAAARGLRLLLVITGKGLRGGGAHDPAPRGVLRRRLPHWLELARTRPLVAAIRPAHPRHGGLGAVYVVLRRARPR